MVPPLFFLKKKKKRKGLTLSLSLSPTSLPLLLPFFLFLFSLSSSTINASAKLRPPSSGRRSAARAAPLDSPAAGEATPQVVSSRSLPFA